MTDNGHKSQLQQPQTHHKMKRWCYAIFKPCYSVVKGTTSILNIRTTIQDKTNNFA